MWESCFTLQLDSTTGIWSLLCGIRVSIFISPSDGLCLRYMDISSAFKYYQSVAKINVWISVESNVFYIQVCFHVRTTNRRKRIFMRTRDYIPLSSFKFTVMALRIRIANDTLQEWQIREDSASLCHYLKMCSEVK